MESILPVLQIDDYDVAVEFYVRGLGFEIVMEHRHEPNFPVFMIIKKGDLHLALSEHGRGIKVRKFIFIFMTLKPGKKHSNLIFH